MDLGKVFCQRGCCPERSALCWKCQGQVKGVNPLIEGGHSFPAKRPHLFPTPSYLGWTSDPAHLNAHRSLPTSEQQTSTTAIKSSMSQGGGGLHNLHFRQLNPHNFRPIEQLPEVYRGKCKARNLCSGGQKSNLP